LTKEQKTFEIRSYGKSELAMMYFPDAASKASALKRLRYWLRINPRLRQLLDVPGNSFQPRHVQLIVDEVGEPY
jgi:hypothetical protein